ncbi:MAG: DUF3139 domain-containing protein [Clostridium sp.]
MKKLILFILITICFICVIIGFNRITAKQHIENYIKGQGINRNDILVESFFKDWVQGGYIYNISVDGEESDIYYNYHYIDGEVKFNASKFSEKYIKEKIWGGEFLDYPELNNLKYPPLTP